MSSSGQRALRWLVVVGLAVGLAGLGAWRLDTASGQQTVVSVEPPSSTHTLGGGDFSLNIQIDSVQNLGSYDWELRFDPDIIEFVSVANGGFLASLNPYCPPPTLSEGVVRFACATTGGTGASGSGVLSSVTFSPVAAGTSSMHLPWVQLADPLANVNIPAWRGSGCVVIGSGTCTAPGLAPPTTPTPPAPLPSVTLTPHPPIGTEVPPAPTSTPTPEGATPVPPTATPTPTGPLPTPTPVPPGMEVVELFAGCNPVASTYPDGTPIQTIDTSVGRAGILRSVWKFQLGVWLGYAPGAPAQANDLAQTDFLDALFICADASGAFVRPIV